MTRRPTVQNLRAVGLAVMALAGVVSHAIALNEHRPVCSPDGSRLVFMLQSENTGNDWELYLMEMDSQVRSRLTRHEGWDGYAVWAPDGSRIIFDRADVPNGSKRPWIMDLESRTEKPLGTYEGWLSVSDWRGDGTLLAFHELAGQRDLVLLDEDGAIHTRLTDSPLHNEHDAHFSPDGGKIAYAKGTLDGGVTSLQLFEFETGHETVLHTSAGRIYGLSWSPGGGELAFADAPGGQQDNADIFVYSFDEQSVRRVTDDPSLDHMPEYCNNSPTLLFTSYRSGEERIYRIDPDPQPYLKVDRAE